MKKLVYHFFTILTALSLGCLTSCGGNHSDPSSITTVEVSNITIRGSGYNEGETLYMQRGQKILLAATVTPSNATQKIVTWSTNNPDISVTPNENNCYVEAFDLGQAIITAKAGNYEKKIDVECVSTIDPTHIEVDSTHILIPTSTQKTIPYRVLPENATNKNVSVIINPLDNADGSMVKTSIENNQLVITVEQLANVGEKYEITLRSMAVLTVKTVFTIEVAPLEITSMEFKNQDVTISLQDPAYRMLPTFNPLKTSYKEVEFSSDHPEICDIDQTGKLIPHQVGKVVITATNTHNREVTCSTTITVTNDETQYVTRLIKKNDVDELIPVHQTLMDFETDKVAFAAWKKTLSEDSNSASHISDAGWAIWMVGFDTYNDDEQSNGGDANAITYCKITVPQEATKLQFVFRSHPLPDDQAKFRILTIDENNMVATALEWTIFHETTDMFVNIDVTSFQGRNITFVVEQDQIGTKLAGAYMGVSLMFRRCLFDMPENEERFNTDDSYNILLQGK